MATWLTVLVGLLVLSVIVLTHELGHFLMAKLTHCYVKEFGIGFRPRIWGKKIGETIYSINAIPFGGFNDISGEVDPAEPRALAARSHAVRALVISGGIIFNLILPFLLIAIAYMVPHNVAEATVIVKEVTANSPAESGGILVGDTILTINGHEINSSADLNRYIMIALGQDTDIGILRADGTEETVTLVPRWRPPAEDGAVGILPENAGLTFTSESLPFWEAIPEGVVSVWENILLYKNGLIKMFNGSTPVSLVGPVGIVQVTGEVARAGVSPVLELAAIISLAAAITQIIPFPALDGAHLLFIVIEWIRRGKRISARVQTIIHSTGFIILIALMFFLTYQDIARWITGGSLLGG
jgi:regulator of sigma E protease